MQKFHPRPDYVGTTAERTALVPNAIAVTFFDTDEDVWYTWNGTAWVAGGGAGTGFVLKAGDTMTGALALPREEFDTAYTKLGTEPSGSVYWNTDRNTLDVVMPNGVTLQLGQELHFYVINQTGSDIPDGKVVMYDGSLGASGIIKCKLGVSDGTYPAMVMLGVTTQLIADGDTGKVTFFGEVRDFNTSGFTAGDILYIDPATPGGLTNVAPTAPNLKYAIAVALNSKANGSIFVRAIYSMGLAELDDVTISSAANGDLLSYNSVSKSWKNISGLTYVLRTGDTMSGQLTSTVATGTPPFVVASTTEVANLQAARAGNALAINSLPTGASGAHATLTTTPAGTSVTTTYKATAIASGVASVVIIAHDGSTAEGVLEITSTTIKYNSNTIWHAGNDGTGSGLDADLLDGQHATAFAPAILSNIPVDKFMFGFVVTYDGTQQTTIAFDGTNTFTLAPTGTTWDYWRNGVRYTITGSKTVVLSATPPAAAGLYFIFIDATDGTLSASTVPWTLEDTKVPVATVAWNNTLTPKYMLADERHSCSIDRRFHWEHHQSDGTEVISHPVLDGPNVVAGSPANTDNVFGLSASSAADEDIKVSLAALTKPNGVTTDYFVFYNTALTAWAWAKSALPYKYGTYIQYSNGGTMTDAGNGDYVNTFLLMTNKQGDARYSIIPGQAKFANLAAARGELFGSLVKTNLPISEYVAVYQFIWVCDAGYTSAGKCKLAEAPSQISVSASGLSMATSTVWGTIIGTLSNQTDLQAALDGKLDDTNNGTTTTVLHGNAAGAVSFGAVALADMQTIGPNTLLGISNTTGVPTEMSVAQIQTLIGAFSGGGLNADTVDGYSPGNLNGNIALNNTTKNNNLNADAVDGYHASNATASIPISNGTVNTDLNADKLDGYHASEFVKTESRIGNALLYLPFDGPGPYNTDFTGSLVGNLGQTPSNNSNGSTFRPGKFGKAVQGAQATTNLFTNPSFETNISGWTGVNCTISQSNARANIGLYSLKCVSTAAAGMFPYATVTVTAGQAYTVSGWAYVEKATNANASVSALIQFNNSGGAQVNVAGSATISASSGTGWVRVWINGVAGTGAVSANIWITFNNAAIGDIYYLDGMQFENKAYPTPYCDGSMGVGHSWSGTAHASTSARVVNALWFTPSPSIINIQKGTIRTWANFQNGTVNNWEGPWYLSGATAALQMLKWNGNGKIIVDLSTAGGHAYLGVDVGSQAPVITEGWHQIVYTYSGATHSLYYDGVLIQTTQAYTVQSYDTLVLVSGPGVQMNGFIDDFAILDEPWSAAQVKADYDSGMPLLALNIGMTVGGLPYTQGPTFPLYPVVNQRHFRTDLGWECYFDGTRWLTVHEFSAEMDTTWSISVSSSLNFGIFRQDYIPYVTRCECMINAAAPQDAGNYYGINVRGINPAYSGAVIAFYRTTIGMTTGVGVSYPITKNADIDNTYRYWVDIYAGKFGSPGNISQIMISVFYRLIIT